MSALPPKADMDRHGHDVRFVPKADSCTAAKTDRFDHDSITSSARVRIPGGTVMPIALAVLRLTRSSNFVGCSTGRSVGFAPLRILSTNAPARRYKLGTCGP